MGLFDLNLSSVRKTRKAVEEHNKKHLDLGDQYEQNREKTVYENMNELDTTKKIGKRFFGENVEDNERKEIYRVVERLVDRGKVRKIQTTGVGQSNIYEKL